MTRRRTPAGDDPHTDDEAPPSAGPSHVRVACDWLHTEFRAAGHVITPAGVDVPVDDLPALRAAADASGVRLLTLEGNPDNG